MSNFLNWWFKNHFHIVIYPVYFNDIILQFKKLLFQLFNNYSVIMTQVYWTLIINFSSTFWNITLNTWFHSFDTVTNVIYFIYDFIYLNVNFIVYFNVDFMISHPRLPLPLLLYMATLTVVHQTYTEEGMLLLPIPLWVWGTDSEKHPLLHFLTKCSQCHQPQDHECDEQIPANINPPTPQQQSLSSQN